MAVERLKEPTYKERFMEKIIPGFPSSKNLENSNKPKTQKVYLDIHDGSVCYEEYPLFLQYRELNGFKVVIPDFINNEKPETTLTKDQIEKLKELIAIRIPELNLLIWNLEFNGRNRFSITVKNDLQPGNSRVISEIKDRFK